jgi:hypothetical protein
MYIIKIEHHGQGFINNENARLLLAGIRYHWVLIYG